MDPPTEERGGKKSGKGQLPSTKEPSRESTRRLLTDVGDGDSVDKSLLGHDIERLDVLLHEVLEVSADSSALGFLLRRDGRSTRRVRKGHSNDLDDGGHRVGGEESSARSGSRAGVLLGRRRRCECDASRLLFSVSSCKTHLDDIIVVVRGDSVLENTSPRLPSSSYEERKRRRVSARERGESKDRETHRCLYRLQPCTREQGSPP